MANLIQLETDILLWSSNKTDNIGGYKFVDEILSGNFNNVLDGRLVSEIFSEQYSFNNLTDKSIDNIFKLYLNEYLNVNSTAEKQLELMCFGIANLLTFVQSNWTGPPASEECAIPWLNKLYQPDSVLVTADELRETIVKCIVLDGESISGPVKHLELLLLARLIFSSDLSQLMSKNWWLLRCNQIHQQILDEPSEQLHSEIFQLANDLLEDKFLVSISNELLIELRLEIVHAYLLYSHVTKSGHQIKSAIDLLKMDVDLIGALGKRTRYQHRDLAQLTIQVKPNRMDQVEPASALKNGLEIKGLPQTVFLEDDTMLDKINFNNPDIADAPDLNPVEQAALLAKFVHKQKSCPADSFEKEELLPYLHCLISQPKVWSVQASALLLRSRLESSSTRTMDRSLKQLEVHIECLNSTNPPVRNRLEKIFCSYLPPKWKVEADFASVLLSLGAVQTALDVYLRLQMWDGAITCYNLLYQRHKVAEIVRQELNKKESVKLWCFLGDATDDIECYRKAWELSNERSAMAQRCLGNYYFNKAQYSESIPYYERSLSINSIQVKIWFRLGFAALEAESWELCSKAYHRYCALEPDSFEAWNNLGKAYLKQGKKAKAYHALKEAVKCDFENWKLWENMSVVATDCGDFEQVLNAYHRILDLKKKHYDGQILQIMVEAIEKDVKDCYEVPVKNYKNKFLNLFGRITSEVRDIPMLWQLYARLLSICEEDQNDSNTQIRAAQCLQHAHRAATQRNWCCTVTSTLDVLKLCSSLADAYLICGKNCDSPKEKINMLSSAKFSLNGVLTKIKKEYMDLGTNEINTDLLEHYKILENKFETIKKEIDSS